MENSNPQLAAWQRVLFVAIFWVVFYLAQMVVAAVAIAQCVFLLISGAPNEQLQKFGDSLSKFVHDILRYVTFNSEQRPFPFSDFPKPDIIIPANGTSTQ
ncbi:MAG: DUF4389 domain-containing protein [Gammaproteobacteria bacterium]|nr:DUF4389 domain-containing protein [Gammaproteobacteria bacterium]